jgi:hypothetical protein
VDGEIRGNNFYIPGVDGWIFRAFGTFDYPPRNADTKFVSEGGRKPANLSGGEFRTENDLNNTGPITQMDKKDISMVTQRIDPAEQMDVAPDIDQIKPTAV